MKSCPVGLWSKRIWLDVSNSQYWYTPWRDVGYKQNTNFFEGLVDGCNQFTTSDGVTCGIYSSSQQWKYIFNSAAYSYKPSLTMPLWYIANDGVANMNGFTAFGGFTKPYAKSYETEPLGFCDMSNFYINKAVVPQW